MANSSILYPPTDVYKCSITTIGPSGLSKIGNMILWSTSIIGVISIDCSLIKNSNTNIQINAGANGNKVKEMLSNRSSIYCPTFDGYGEPAENQITINESGSNLVVDIMGTIPSSGMLIGLIPLA